MKKHRHTHSRQTLVLVLLFFTESSAHHPLTHQKFAKSGRSQVGGFNLREYPHSVSGWASEVVSVGIVMKGAQSDAEKWI